MFGQGSVLRPCAIAFAVAMALGLSGCGGGGGSNVRPSPPPTDNPTSPPDNPTPPADPDFNVNVDDTTVWPDDHDGTGALTKGGKGTLVVTGTNTYTGGTTIDDGTLQIGDGGTTGSIIGDVANEGSLVFNRSDDITFGGVVSGSGSLAQIGKGTVTLAGDSTYTGGTTIGNGTLQLGNGGKTGSIVGDVANEGSFVFNRSDDITFGGIVSGSGSLAQVGAGRLVLAGDNTYTGGTTINSGTLQVGDGATSGSIVGDVVDNAMLAFSRSDDVDFAGRIAGTGGLAKAGKGTLTLTGANGYTGTTYVNEGSLYVDGDQSAATGATIVANGVVLGGKGILGGDVSVADGATLDPGSHGAIGTLGVKGNLALSGGSILDYTLDQSGDLINVDGNLVLDGSLNVSVALGYDFGPGLYRIINYAGTLTDNGLTLGNVPASGALVQTGIAQQVNLLVEAPGTAYGFWDGDAGPKGNNTIDGGSGIWEKGTSLTASNWTDANGTANTSFEDRSFAVFQAAPGTLTVSDGNGDINVAGMQFASDGYVIQGDAIHLVGSVDDPMHSVVRVGDGTSAGAGYKATINSALDGDSALVKAGAGTLVLIGANTYTDGTTISDGTLQLGNGGKTGWIIGDVANDGSLVFNRSDDITFDGVVSGSGTLAQAGNGRVILTGANTYSGATTITDGILQLGNGGTTGSIVGDVANDGSLVFNRSDDITFDSIVSGSGALVQAGMGTLILTGTNTYTGGTSIDQGTLQIGNFGETGSVTGDVRNNGSLWFRRQGVLSYDGIVSGSGTLVKGGSGTLILTGASTYTGGTTVLGGTLEIVPGAALGTGSIVVGNTQTPYYYSNHILKVDSGVSLSNHILLSDFGTLDNAGVLSAAVDNAVGGSGDVITILNHDGGSIEGKTSAVMTKFRGTVKNNSGGIIEGIGVGVGLGGGGLVGNDGVGSIIQSSGGIAIQVSGESGTVENTGGGRITGGSTAIYLQHGGKVTNGIGSTIEATSTTDGDCSGTGACGIFVESGDSTASSFNGELTLINAGTIIGSVQMIPTAYNGATLLAGGSIQGDLDMGSNNGSFLTLDGGAGTVQLYSHAVTGTTTFAGLFFKSGDGTWVIDNDDLDTVFHTEISGGVLQVGNGGVEGSIGSGVVQFNGKGTLAFDRSDDVVFTGKIIGPDMEGQHASLVQAGTGTLILPDIPVSLSGLDLTIERGAVQLGNGQVDSIYIRDFDVTDNGSLVFDLDGETFFLESMISGTGSLTKQGPGMLFLEKANTYTGGTTVNNGTLQTMEALPGNVTVNTGAVLVGAAWNGTPPGLPGATGNLSNAGRVVVRDGNSTVGGSYTQAATGTLAVSLGSKLDVTGAATLDGGTLEVTGADSGYVANTHTDVLTATGGVDGTFDQLVKDTGVVFTATTINYDANSVWLDTTGLNVTTAAAGGGVDYTPASMGSAVRVQGAFEQLNDKVATGSLDSVSSDFVQAAGQFQQSPDLHAAQASLESLSGQLHAASAGMVLQAIDAAGRALSDRLDDADGPVDGQRHTWIRQLSQGGDMARTGFADVDYQLDGWLAGTDVRVGQHALAGFAFSQGSGMEQLAGRFDRNRSRNTEGMVYAGWTDDHWYAQGRVGMGQYRQRINRMLLLGTSYQGVWTQYDGRYNVAYGESGLRFDVGSTRLTPFVDLEYDRVTRDGFAEQGAGGFGLKAGDQALSRWQGGLGLKLARQLQFAGGRSLGLDARAQWRRTLSADGAAFDASFVGLDAWRPLSGVGLSRRSAVFGLDLDARPSANTRFKLGYEYLTGDRGRAGVASARFSLDF